MTWSPSTSTSTSTSTSISTSTLISTKSNFPGPVGLADFRNLNHLNQTARGKEHYGTRSLLLVARSEVQYRVENDDTSISKRAPVPVPWLEAKPLLQQRCKVLRSIPIQPAGTRLNRTGTDRNNRMVPELASVQYSHPRILLILRRLYLTLNRNPTRRLQGPIALRRGDYSAQDRL